MHLEKGKTLRAVVVRHGSIVFERYAEGSDKDSIATSWSTAKSFTSALAGIAIDKGSFLLLMHLRLSSSPTGQRMRGQI